MFEGAVVVVGAQGDDESKWRGRVFDRDRESVEECIGVVARRAGEELLELIDDDEHGVVVGPETAADASEYSALAIAELAEQRWGFGGRVGLKPRRRVQKLTRQLSEGTGLSVYLADDPEA